jgi:hypothetical protein
MKINLLYLLHLKKNPGCERCEHYHCSDLLQVGRCLGPPSRSYHAEKGYVNKILFCQDQNEHGYCPYFRQK